MERYKFHSRTCKSGESIVIFAAEIRRLTEHCEFKDNLNDQLLDRFVCGINDSRIQRCLLSEKKLDFPTAIQVAKSLEWPNAVHRTCNSNHPARSSHCNTPLRAVRHQMQTQENPATAAQGSTPPMNAGSRTWIVTTAVKRDMLHVPAVVKRSKHCRAQPTAHKDDIRSTMSRRPTSRRPQEAMTLHMTARCSVSRGPHRASCGVSPCQRCGSANGIRHGRIGLRHK